MNALSFVPTALPPATVTDATLHVPTLGDTLDGAIDNCRRMLANEMRHLNGPVPWLFNAETWRASIRCNIARIEAQLIDAELSVADWHAMTPDERRKVGVMPAPGSVCLARAEQVTA